MNEDRDRCPDCKTFWVSCPCCHESFCPDCTTLEADAKWEDEE